LSVKFESKFLIKCALLQLSPAKTQEITEIKVSNVINFCLSSSKNLSASWSLRTIKLEKRVIMWHVSVLFKLKSISNSMWIRNYGSHRETQLPIIVLNVNSICFVMGLHGQIRTFKFDKTEWILSDFLKIVSENIKLVNVTS
jgi:hypothetical protein